MLVKAFVILLCLQSMVLPAQSGSRRGELPEKSKECTPAEEKWWNDLRKKDDEILDLVDQLSEAARHRDITKKVTSQIETRRKELIALIKTGQDNKYNAPVDDNNRIIILFSPRTEYSEEARHLRVEGTVLVEAEYSADGRMSNARVLRGLGHGLDQKALDAVYNIVFLPSISAGRFQTTKLQTRVGFFLL